MRPTFEMLVFNLSRQWAVRWVPPERDTGQLSLPLLFNPSAPLQADGTYIAQADDLRTDESFAAIGCLICCGGDPGKQHESGRCGVIVIDSHIRLDEVFNFVQGIFLLYQNWEEDLQALVGSTTSMQDLLDISGPVLENLLCLVDENGDVISSTAAAGELDDVNTPASILNGSFNERLVQRVNRRLADRFYTFDIMSAESNAEIQLLLIRYYLGKVHVATLCMLPSNHPLQKHDVQLLETLAFFIQIQVLRPPQIESEMLKSAAASLLSGGSLKASETESLHAALYHAPSDRFRCIVIGLPADVLPTSGTYLQRRIKVELPASIALVHDGYLVGIFNETKSDWDADRFYRSISCCLGKTSFTAGISDGFCDLADLQSYYREAKAVVAFADMTSELDRARIFSFEDCRDRYVLKNCAGDLPPHMLLTSGYKRLKELDENSAVSYLETLRAYLEEGRNDSRAAARLFVCRNTFLYRLDKLQSALGEDLDDPDVRFRLELCLRLDSMQEGQAG